MSNPLVAEHSSSKRETEAVPSPPFHPGGGGGCCLCAMVRFVCITPPFHCLEHEGSAPMQVVFNAGIISYLISQPRNGPLSSGMRSFSSYNLVSLW